MSSVPREQWTAEERRLARLVKRTKEPGGLGRIAAQFKIQKMIQKHGKEAVDAMWERIK